MNAVSNAAAHTRDVRAAIGRNPMWYHSIEVAPGVVTPGWFDLRPVVDRLPWPDVRGKRCLDVGTYDGWFAFELERRGAAEVLATDIADHELWDWPLRLRARGPEYFRQAAGPEKGIGFEIARGLLGSSARLQQVSVYDLSPDSVGEFDVVTCGSLLLHLRDPLRALAAIRSVCRGHLLSAEQVDVRPSLRRRETPSARLDGVSDRAQWWIPNVPGHRRLLEASGFEPEQESGVYAIPFGPAHPPRAGGVKGAPGRLARRLLAGGDGVPHHAILARAA